MKEIKLIYTPTNNLNEFKDAARRAKELGATHVMAGQMPRSRWMWEEDLSNPYVNWSMGQAQIFKLVCPPELEEFLPTEHIRECFELFKNRCDILHELGLKPGLFSNEPFWLPEKVYRRHPDWRGARCDHPRRSTRAYYSPCIENPEVLQMYRQAVRRLCAETGLDYINFKTNDCGGGLSFSAGTYSGPNGAWRYRNVSMTNQVCGFLDAISEGAAEGGNTGLVVHFSSDLEFKEPEYAVNAAIMNLKDNQLINHRDKDGKIQMSVIGGTGLTETVIPSLPRNITLLSSLVRLQNSPAPIKILRLNRTDLHDAYYIYKALQQTKAKDVSEQYQVLRSAAAEIVGDSFAGELLDIWKLADDAQFHMEHTGLDLIQYGCQHQRWINRPFLLFPGELPKEEGEYFRKFQFQAQGEENADDLMDLQGIEGVRGFTAVFLITQTVEKALRCLEEAETKLDFLIDGLLDAAVRDGLSMLRKRLLVYQCFIRNVENACRFQELADRIDPEYVPPHSLRWPTRPDHRAEEFQEITRFEIDNAYQLADILDDCAEKLLCLAPPELEDIFTFSTQLPAQLRRKAEIMLDHMTDSNRVFETNNI